MGGMRRLFALLLASAGVGSGQLIEARIEFHDTTGCVSCAESLQGRLERVRGVEEVSLDLDAGVIEIVFAEDNRVRLAPLRARITQDGTDIAAMRIVARGLLDDAVFTLGHSGETLGISGVKLNEKGRFLLVGRLMESQNKTPALQLHVDSATPLE